MQVPTIIQVSLIDFTGDSYHRMRWPADFVAHQRPHWRVINLDFRAEERFSWGLDADLLVLLHCGDIEFLPLIEERKKRGLKTLIELNDNFYHPQPWNQARQWWSSPLIWNLYEKLAAAADGVLVSGPGLYELFEPKNPGKVHIIENHYPEKLQNFEEVYKDPQSEFVLGWAGSAGHMADLLSVLPILRELLDEHSNLKIHLMGDQTIPDFVRLPSDRVKYFPFGSVQSYLDFWNNVHLAFVPLLDNPYNRCRSDIKAVEISGKAVLPIVQNSFTYQKFISQTQVPVYSTPEELKKYIKIYLADTQKLKSDTKRAYEYVRKERIGTQRTERADLYESLLPKELVSGARAWAFEAGSYEIEGSLEKVSRLVSILGSAQKKFDSKDLAGVLQLSQEAQKQNPYQSEYFLLELKGLGVSHPLFKTRLHSAKDRFDFDLRLLVLEIQALADTESKNKVWNELYTKLRNLREDLREVFKPSVLHLVFKELRASTDNIYWGEKILELFHMNWELRLQLAEAHIVAKNYARARELYLWLSYHKELVEKNRAIIEQNPLYVYQVWDSAAEILGK